MVNLWIKIKKAHDPRRQCSRFPSPPRSPPPPPPLRHCGSIQSISNINVSTLRRKGRRYIRIQWYYRGTLNPKPQVMMSFICCCRNKIGPEPSSIYALRKVSTISGCLEGLKQHKHGESPSVEGLNPRPHECLNPNSIPHVHRRCWLCFHRRTS
jgi:hypothetical protein